MKFASSVAMLIWLSCSHVALADWPAYRANHQRTAFRTQSIKAKVWEATWSRQFPSPRAAWIKPARGSIWQNLTYIEPRVTDDRANVPIIAKDKAGKRRLILPSSADDRLIGIDLQTGETDWQVETDGPIRFAPSIQDGVAYFGADDGLVRAVDLRNGQVVWQARVGPEYEFIVGNGRLVSPHPIRTSVLVQGDQVIAHAGLFPSQGVYSVALSVLDGKVKWRKRINSSSQGYLLASEQRTYVPTGRSAPYAIDSTNGKKLFDLPSPGGTFCMLTPKAFFTGPGNAAEVQSYSAANKAKMLSYKARQVAVGQGKIWTANGARIACHDLSQVSQGKQKTVWQVNAKSQNGLIVTGDKTRLVLLAASKESVDFIDANSGQLIQTIELDPELGEVVHLAISDGDNTSDETLIATTDKGYVLSWRGVEKEKPTSRQRTIRNGTPQKSLEAKTDQTSISKAINQLKSKRGFALVAGHGIDLAIEQLLSHTSLHIVGVVNSKMKRRTLREKYRSRLVYGHRVVVLYRDADQSGSCAKGLFNLVINLPGTKVLDADLRGLVAPGTGVFLDSNSVASIAPATKGQGSWRHQYASPKNLADSNDQRVGTASAFKLKWFGGVGPSRMPDRHLRGPAPLSAKSSMIVQADGILIGVDPANGTERWQFELPEQAMRYVTPYDGGYACLTSDGEQVTIAANQEILTLDAYTGARIGFRKINERDMRFGYLSRTDDLMLVTKMKNSAPRIATDRKTQRTFVDSDYRSERPLVCSRSILAVDKDLETKWTRKAQGVIPNGTVAVDYENSRLVFLEGRSEACLNHTTDRINVKDILEEARLVCLDVENGKLLWEKPIAWKEARNILYAQICEEGIILTSSQSLSGKARYYFRSYSIKDGTENWRIEHDHIKGGLYHGEQVHHPLILKRPDGDSVLVAEPFFYELKTGKKIIPFGNDPNWAIRRPGHSCGTLSGAGNCLFFRANNPTVLNLNQTQENKFTALAPSRPGCWINMIPAGGQLLIPEASASCVCQYSLQTSMCFEPVAKSELHKEIKILPNVEPEIE